MVGVTWVPIGRTLAEGETLPVVSEENGVIATPDLEKISVGETDDREETEMPGPSHDNLTNSPAG